MNLYPFQKISFLLVITSTICLLYIPRSLGEDDEQYLNCSALFQCANIPNIGYPFWGSSRPNYCGYPEFKLNCTGDSPVISFQEKDYRVLDINQSASTLRIARTDYWNNVCPVSPGNTTIEVNHVEYASDVQELLLFYDCPPLNIPLQIQLTSQFNCSINSTANYINYFVTQNLTNSGLTNISGTFGTCHTTVNALVSQSAGENLATNSTKDNLVAVLDSGFGLTWDASNNLCKQCNGSGGQCGYNTATAEFTCYCKDGPHPSNCAGLATGFYVMVIILCSICIWWKQNVRKSLPHVSSGRMVSFVQKEKRDEFDVEAFIRNYGSLTPKRYTYENVKKMTDSFRDKIGKGGYGTVYKGRLPDGLLVAVKVLSESKGNGGEDFINEVASIGRTSHVNIVTLSGFCYEGDKRALIYEYMPNGSLDNFIHKHGSGMANFLLEWKTLSEIAVGIARGLEYLHRGCNTRILHFDIKPQNILLDKDFRPKISDFGLAKLCKTKDSIVSMIGTRGTAGYIAPEVFSRNFGGVSHKSDVYSYGMLVLEMVGAKNNLDSGVSHSSEMFPHYVYKDLELEKDENAFGAITEEEKEIGRKMVLISLWCIQTIPSDRPSMSKVVEMLEGPLHSLRIAPKPFLFSPTIATEDSMTTTSGGSTMGSMVSDGPMAALEMASRSHVCLGSHGRRPHGEEDMQAVREKIEGGRKEKEREEEEEDND
ncbi:LEAF RUST 10 DISEASE-RESISTANCE LOCUS RECEPTOR-LIKE PROTEIN KINASE-like 2.1 isoform X2 [Prunus persica]|uniref:LEAF RUST 10 DISEASE-RESISTANCE LOCUS RECEPTOR-LIKE PROTEIN KINASE-like 2.1 isoform X2 n=1 Tax=Prunus persica TaxID=3760 RepID=UPI0009AB5909|nr:LEAF RUST 10 DISEASE-RESISTANCE LOCUS RECEPTOR-LIKE PROTEIN KINASE-like 2.1 isoform X2 [Prunus persica]